LNMNGRRYGAETLGSRQPNPVDRFQIGTGDFCDCVLVLMLVKLRQRKSGCIPSKGRSERSRFTKATRRYLYVTIKDKHVYDAVSTYD